MGGALNVSKTRLAHFLFQGVFAVLVLGIILLLIGYLVPIHILYVIGLVLTVVGAVLLVLDFTGRPIGGRRWY